MERRIRMNRKIYMRSLGERLRKLPKEDFDMAMEYFREYFDEAGPDNEERAIEDLGTPQQAAEQIIMNLAARNGEEAPKTSVKKGMSAVWVGILAVFAAPIALPLALGVVLTVGALGLSVVAVLASLVLAAFCLIVGSAAAVILGTVMLVQSPANAAATIGAGLICMGIGLLLAPACVSLTKSSLRMLTRIFGRMVQRFTKGGREHEDKR